ncbi:UDP-N-acetylmuramate dehydrogenase [Calderihabitans maritimus]|uniref:UDP-N-acetylenolpyruvoylglucosamine reductase n=1 Tax=Calderihabitans maritimus TaxID=1246530 RepID=A0A1Z5HRI6_9FIRM|nr:UDP-N-acetylmuramate dehydrogenase [Calderihabitans maritimus]GAW92142.1 UDP-N-acetylenolpyruvoylglucosamine reductase [Calderihabitans maritimus]
MLAGNKDWKKSKEELERYLQGEVIANAPLKDHTTWRIGGPADLLVLPRSWEDIKTCFSWAGQYEIPVTVIGNGSNILVLDQGIRGLVIKTSAHFNNIEVKEDALVVDAGAKLPLLARKAAEHSLSGLEFAIGIPGTVGGAILMNAGAEGDNIGELVEKVWFFKPPEQMRELEPERLEFGYRYSSLQKENGIVIRAVLRLKAGSRSQIEEKMRENLARRKRVQPVDQPSAGSVFKNPSQKPAWYFIEKAGAKGLRRGDAKVSEKHANFIVNCGNARAEDVLNLVREVQLLVERRFGIWLEPEIKVLGEGSHSSGGDAGGKVHNCGGEPPDRYGNH